METPIFTLAHKPAYIKPKACGRVAILAGGDSPERSVSLISGEAVLNICQNLGLDATLVDPKFGWQPLLEGQFDRVFIALHGGFGEDGRVQAMLDICGLPYTGSGSLACALSMDKIKAKALWLQMGLPTLPYCAPQTLQQLEFWAELQGYPIVVKPSHGGSSLGVAHAHDSIDLATAYQTASRYGTVIAEAMVTSPRELTVGILNNQVLPPVEIKPRADFYNYEAKYSRSDTTYLAPAPLNRQETQRIQQLAWQAFQCIGGAGWGRVDFLMTESNELFLLEVNSVPGLSPNHSLILKSAQAAGLSFPEVINGILLSALPKKVNPKDKVAMV